MNVKDNERPIACLAILKLLYLEGKLNFLDI